MKAFTRAAFFAVLWLSPAFLFANEHFMGAFTLSADNSGKVRVEREVNLLKLGGEEQAAKIDSLNAAFRSFYTAFVSGDTPGQEKFLAGEMLGARTQKLPGRLTASRISVHGSVVKILIRFERGPSADAEFITDAHEWRMDSGGAWKVRSWMSEAN